MSGDQRHESPVYFRVDADQDIGTGHMERCLLLAEALHHRGHESVFLLVSTSETYRKRIADAGHRSLLFDDGSPAQWWARFTEHGPEPGLVVIDTDDPAWHEQSLQRQITGSRFRLMYITIRPLSDHYLADIILNPNLIARTQEYRHGPGTRLLLGPEHFIFRDEFRSRDRTFALEEGPPWNCFLFFGGADRNHLTIRSLEGLKISSDLLGRIMIVTGSLYEDSGGLQRSIRESPLPIEWISGTDTIRETMESAHFGIVSGGLAMWEMACLGRPVMVVASSGREKEYTPYLDELGYIDQIASHDAFPEKEIFQERVEKNLRQGFRDLRSREFQMLIDPDGIEGVVEAMTRKEDA